MSGNVDEHYRIEYYDKKKINDWRMAVAINAYKEVRYGNGDKCKGRIVLPSWMRPQDLIHLAYETVCEAEKKNPGQCPQLYKDRAIGELKDIWDKATNYNESTNVYPTQVSYDTNNLSIEGSIYRQREKAERMGRLLKYLTQEEKDEKAQNNLYYAPGDTVRTNKRGEPVPVSLLTRQIKDVLPLPKSESWSFKIENIKTSGEDNGDFSDPEISDEELDEEIIEDHFLAEQGEIKQAETDTEPCHDRGQLVSDYSLGVSGWHDDNYEIARISTQEKENWEFSSTPCFNCKIIHRCIAMIGRPIDKATTFANCSPRKIYLEDGIHKQILELWLLEGYRFRRSGNPNFSAIARKMHKDRETVAKYFKEAIEKLKKYHLNGNSLPR
jgi:hypothetical protein